MRRAVVVVAVVLTACSSFPDAVVEAARQTCAEIQIVPQFGEFPGLTPSLPITNNYAAIAHEVTWDRWQQAVLAECPDKIEDLREWQDNRDRHGLFGDR